jgi:pyridinium-3,5-biscarboxylic acid mononucleotide sulfurtransferase
MKIEDPKIQKLNSIFNELGSFIVAFSGGVDSSFLLYHAFKTVKSSAIAVTIKTPYIPSIEIEESIEFTSRYGIKHKIIDLPIPDIIRLNPIDRCYLCKRKLFSELKIFAKKNNFKYIIDGTNADDAGDFRPGMKALKELGIRSPLLESGFTKSEIRELSKTEGLDFWDKPAMACLLTRIPYDIEIKESSLKMIEQAESLLFEKGFPGTRVRIHEDIARIECLPGYLEKIIRNPDREVIVSDLKKIGFRYVSLDLEGYRTGSLNPRKKEV